MRTKFLAIYLSFIYIPLFILSFEASACNRPMVIVMDEIVVTPSNGSSGQLVGGISFSSGFVVEAAAGDSCFVGIELNPNLRISNVDFVDENNNVVLGGFKPNSVVGRSLGRSYAAFVTSVPATIIPTAVSLRINVEILRPSVQLPEMTDLLSRARVVSGSLNPNGEIGDHLTVTSPPRNGSLCLDFDANGKPVCPPAGARPELTTPAALTSLPSFQVMAREVIDGTCPNPFVPCNCTLDGFQAPCGFVQWCLEIGACVRDN